jgi:hypothetical protein
MRAALSLVSTGDKVREITHGGGGGGEGFSTVPGSVA